MSKSQVSFVVMGVEMKATIGGAETECEARSKIIAQIAQSFHIRAVTPLPAPRPQRNNPLRKAGEFFKNILMRLPC